MDKELARHIHTFQRYEQRAVMLWDVLLGFAVITTVMVRLESESFSYVAIFVFVLLVAALVYRVYFKAIKKSRMAVAAIAAPYPNRSSFTYAIDFYWLKGILLIIPPGLTGHLYFIDTAAAIALLWFFNYWETKRLYRLLRGKGQ